MVKRLIPSMFHRRLAMLLVAFAGVLIVLGTQLGRLTLVQGAQHLADARARLVVRTWMPTVRGRILDRRGRVLAQARPSYDIALAYPVLTGAWVEQRAGAFARRRYKAIWPTLDNAQRAALIDRFRPAYQSHLDAMWLAIAQRTGVSVEELADRRSRVEDRITRRHAWIVSARTRRAIEAELARGREITTELRDRIEGRARDPIREQVSAHVIAWRVPDATAFEIGRLAGRMVEIHPDPRDPSGIDTAPMMPGLTVQDTFDRSYPFERMIVSLDRATLPGPLKGTGELSVTVDGVLTQVLGTVRDGSAGPPVEQRAERLRNDPDFAHEVRTPDGTDRGRYVEGDQIGLGGIEESREDKLRGLRGLEIRHLDTGERSAWAPQGGVDVHLTIDVQLQARIQAAMMPEVGLAVVQDWHGQESATMPLGTAINGAAVVLDIDTGEILAMVSTPTTTRRAMRDDPEAVLGDILNTPWINRCLYARYPPGSVVKALLVVGSVSRGRYGLDERIACTGHLLEGNPNAYRCWIYKRYRTTHSDVLGHDLDAVDALTVSCNIFFYTLGRRLGTRELADLYRDFGLGQRFGLGAGPESPGSVGARGDGSDLKTWDAILMGIGQGPVDWTPMHAANAYATIARFGVRIDPRLVMGAPSRDKPEPLALDPAAVAAVLTGLERAVNDPMGTGQHIRFPSGDEPIFNCPGVRVWGKTGTAQAPSLFGDDPDGDGPAPRPILRSGDHSWFVVLAGNDRPRYAIAVLMEYAGSGGKVSGPIANQIIHALADEGYLSRADR